MCGIAGIINQNNSPVDEDQLKIMTRSVAHRGPDGEGFYVDGKLGFGHRRLSIIDLSKAGHQPMYFGDEFVITFNGEIYNYIEIRDQLRKLGHAFATQTDTEVILVAYKEWGAACVSRFNGMWAFAIHDKKQNIVFCSRDRFGVKPFYYTTINGQFIFGSEIKQFKKFKECWKANRNVLLDYMIFNLIDHNSQTFFDGVEKLPGSHNLIYHLDSDKFEVTKYYEITLHADIGKLNEQDTLELFKEEINRSVDWRLRSDVKVGTCLSGGLDSSFVASLAGGKYKNEQEKFSAITAQSVDLAQDESLFAKMVVDHCDLKWLVTTPTSADFLFFLDEVIYNQDEPFISPSVYMQHFVMKKARENGVVVLLDGQGADEVLLGYERYLGAYFKALPVSRLLTNMLNAKDHFGTSAISIFKYYLYFTSFSVRYRRNLWRFSHLSPKYREFIEPSTIRHIADSYKNIRDLQQLEIFSTQLPSLLRFEDKNSMANSIETRLPFLDWNFVEMALSMNNEFKIKAGWSKYILRQSMDPILPQEITWRKRKFGFNAPTQLWFDHFKEADNYIRESEILSKIFEGNLPPFDDPNVKWRMINIARWEKVHHVSID